MIAAMLIIMTVVIVLGGLKIESQLAQLQRNRNEMMKLDRDHHRWMIDRINASRSEN